MKASKEGSRSVQPSARPRQCTVVQCTPASAGPVEPTPIRRPRDARSRTRPSEPRVARPADPTTPAARPLPGRTRPRRQGRRESESKRRAKKATSTWPAGGWSSTTAAASGTPSPAPATSSRRPRRSRPATAGCARTLRPGPLRSRRPHCEPNARPPGLALTGTWTGQGNGRENPCVRGKSGALTVGPSGAGGPSPRL